MGSHLCERRLDAGHDILFLCLDNFFTGTRENVLHLLDHPRFELMRAGCPVPLEKIPFDLMVLLLERAGEAITREEITIALWGAGTFQDLDASLNTAVRKIRVALQDSPDNPRFLQTIVGRGYRFIAPLDNAENGVKPATITTTRYRCALPMAYSGRGTFLRRVGAAGQCWISCLQGTACSCVAEAGEL